MRALTGITFLAAIGLLPSCELPDRPAVRADGTIAIAGDQLLLSNLESGVRRRIPMPERQEGGCAPIWPAWSHDGRFLAFTCCIKRGFMEADECDRVGLADVDSGTVRLFPVKAVDVEGDAAAWFPSWSPMENTFVFTFMLDPGGEGGPPSRSELHAFSIGEYLDDAERRVLLSEGFVGMSHAWFPDGKSIAVTVTDQYFSTENDDWPATGALARLWLASGKLERLADVAFPGFGLVEVTRDGAHIFFSTPSVSFPAVDIEDSVGSAFGVWRYEIASRLLSRIPQPGPVFYFALSPSGERLLYLRKFDRSGDRIWVREGGRDSYIGDTDEETFLPIWLDDDRILFTEEDQAKVYDLSELSGKFEVVVTDRLLGVEKFSHFE